ncbi:MAG: DUF2059 domain-containing protein [bacterium]
MRKYIVLFALIVSSNLFAQSSLEDRMRSYLTTNGTVAYYEQVIDRLFDFLNEEYQNQKVPNEIWTDLKEELNKDSVNDITTLITQSYQGHFTNEELNEMLNFYESSTGQAVLLNQDLTDKNIEERDAFYASPLGSKITSASESLNAVLKQLTQEWSAQLFRDAELKLAEKGFKRQ